MASFVVAVDGSDGSVEALRWAIDMAEVHDATLTAVTAWSWLDQPEELAFSATYTEDDARSELEATVKATLGDRPPGRMAPIAARVVNDLPVPGLQSAAEGADLLIVGARGHGGFASLRVGSVSERLLESSPCPIAVVHAAAPVKGGRVVVGVDASATSHAALRWAAAEAAARDADLDVVQAWSLPVSVAAPYDDGVVDLDLYESGERQLLSEALAEPTLAEVRVTAHLVTGGAARALLERADGAALVVVGSRG
ncbi:MAG TPA: universal stress protein, partial [Acidimicrobiales bacterium]